MISIKDKIECCGCNACGDICSRNAITFRTDIEGFWYPEVDSEKCNGCGLCDKTCPIANINALKKNDSEYPLNTIAAVNRRMDIRWDSTSGGAFTALAEGVFSDGGYVGGAVFNERFLVNQVVSDNPDDLPRLRSSKYLQSDATGFYRAVKSALQTQKPVLVCGTPCQMAALRAFLRKPYDNLIIVDFICRGVNSPKVFRAYLDSLEKRHGGRITYIKEKNKELGWRSLTRKVAFSNGRVYYGAGMQDDFRRGYHTNVYCRPSCYDCKFKGFPRIADITIADYWGIEKVDKNLDNNAGTSMILLNSQKGKEYFEKIKECLEYTETPFEKIFGGNVALRKSISPAKVDRREFFADLDRFGFDYVTEKYYPKRTVTTKVRIKKLLKQYMKLGWQLGWHPRAWVNFMKVNFRKNTQSDFKSGNYIFTKRSAVFDLHPTARIIVDAPFVFGNNPVRGLTMPTCLRMEKGTTLTIHGGPLTRYGNGPYNLRYGAYIEIVNGGNLVIGQGAANVGLTIMCAKEVTIGNGVRIGRNVSIRDWNGPHVIVTPTYRNHAPVHIGDYVWLCSGCTIMPGVTIGEGSVVAANATVTRDVPPHVLVGGSPAKVLKENVEWY